VGRLLEEYKYRYFEEPVMFDQLEDIKEVADALTLPIANGEQDYSFHSFRWLVANDGLEIVQPDNYYFGGLIRSMRVALMGAAFKKQCVPHMSGGGLGYLYNIQFVSCIPNVDGRMKVPTGPGFGVDLDPEWVKKHQPVTM
jgi:L-alanine-DL-glutamate epimerase-like enolase superfamily enzyme